jgi:hypothetical protein
MDANADCSMQAMKPAGSHSSRASGDALFLWQAAALSASVNVKMPICNLDRIPVFFQRMIATKVASQLRGYDSGQRFQLVFVLRLQHQAEVALALQNRNP